MKLDLKTMKKVAQDKNSATFLHKDGHKINIAYSGVSKQMREELKKLPIHAAGGTDTDSGTAFDPVNDDHPEDTDDSGITFSDIGNTIAQGAKGLQKITGAGTTTPQQDQSAAQAAQAAQDAGVAAGNVGPYANPQNYAAALGSQPTGAAAEDQSDDSDAPDATIAPPDAPDSVPPSEDDSGDDGTFDETAAAQTADALPPPAAINPPTTSADMDNDDTAYAQALAQGKITPKTYNSLFANLSTPGKVMTLFGLLLSGAGSGLAHQSNAVLDMMNKQIDNDLNAQKATAENAHNFLNLHYQHQMQKAQMGHLAVQNAYTQALASKVPSEIAENKARANLTGSQSSLAMSQKKLTDANTQLVATQSTKAKMELSMVQEMLNQAQGLPPGPTQDAAVQAVNGTIAPAVHAHIAQGNKQVGDQIAARSQLQNNDPEAAFTHKIVAMKMMGGAPAAAAEALEKRHMPGVPGVSSVPLTDENRSYVSGANMLSDSVNRLKAFVAANPHPLPKSAADAQGKVYAANLTAAYRAATHGGVYKEGEQNFINQIVPEDPTTWNPLAQVGGKLDALNTDVQAKKSNYLQSLGFPVQATPPPGPAEGTVQINKRTGARRVMRNGQWSQ